MKKYLSILLVMILGFTFYVKADAGPPAVAQYKIMTISPESRWFRGIFV